MYNKLRTECVCKIWKSIMKVYAKRQQQYRNGHNKQAKKEEEEEGTNFVKCANERGKSLMHGYS